MQAPRSLCVTARIDDGSQRAPLGKLHTWLWFRLVTRSFYFIDRFGHVFGLIHLCN